MTQAPSSRTVARVAARLERDGIGPVLIGGLALVIYGSTRVTRDCDFAVGRTEEVIRRSVTAMVDEGFSVIFGWDPERFEPTKVETRAAFAASWAVIDRPESIWFWHPGEQVRVDFVFELPVPVDELVARAEVRTMYGTRLLVAAPEDLLRMKEVSAPSRENPMKRISDEHDLMLLRELLKRRPG